LAVPLLGKQEWTNKATDLKDEEEASGYCWEKKLEFEVPRKVSTEEFGRRSMSKKLLL
jgi:hypothetical protein